MVKGKHSGPDAHKEQKESRHEAHFQIDVFPEQLESIIGRNQLLCDGKGLRQEIKQGRLKANDNEQVGIKKGVDVEGKRTYFNWLDDEQ